MPEEVLKWLIFTITDEGIVLSQTYQMIDGVTLRSDIIMIILTINSIMII